MRVFYWIAIVTYILSIIRRLPVIGHFDKFILPLTMLFLFIIANKKKIWRYVYPSDILVMVFVIFSIFTTLVIYPRNSEYLWYNFDLYILYCIPAFLVGLSSVEYDEDMFLIISRLSCVSIVASFFLLFYYGSLGKETIDELGQSYAVLPNTLFVLAYYVYSRKKFYLLFSVLGIAYALMLGSRGPIILILVFIALSTIYKNKERLPVVLVIGLAVYLFIEFGLYRDVLLGISRILKNMGYSTRIIDLTLAGEAISHTSGRDEIYELLLDILKSKPFTGYGLFGEWQFVGWNAHELYLEVVFEYGWPLGVLLIFLYVKSVITSSLKCMDNEVITFFNMIFIVYVLVQGCMSYSHLRPELFLLLGFSLMQNRKRNFENLIQ